MKISKQLSQLEILVRIDQIKAELDGLRPLSEEQEGRIFQKLRLDWNYHSNAIEGNSLTYGETRALLMYGLTAKGKPFKDHLDIKGHNEAIDFLLALIKDPRPLSEQDIREMHKLVLQESYSTKAQTQEGKEVSKVITLGQYKTSANHVKTATGEIHYYATPEETPAKMNDLMAWYAKASQSNEVHPVVLAALFHYRFVAIHPFDDGNGRMARLLMNLVLMRHSYPPVVIKQDNNSRNQYYNALAQADAGEHPPFTTLIVEALKHSLEIYLKGAKGEDINEPDDLDKELALFRKELKGKEGEIKILRTPKIVSKVSIEQIQPFLTTIENRMKSFQDMFERVEYGTIDDNFEVEVFSSTTDIVAHLCKHTPTLGAHSFFISLKNFKHVQKPFTSTIELSFLYDRYQYHIDIQVESLDVVNISKYYHQPITEPEAEHFAVQIGQDLLAYIKAKYKNGEQDSPLPF
ncbi:Fic family protein [Microscilla marina]|uniref:Filamentation induced by cAMP protein Fic n=1 Tax=Microscilla marina ATCC 23134 TaxID=313606 RepID=A1ZY14_MICM2|nr:Fic family protein [Microscilla marina]EAY24751.1 filamentation induced by cAMP protein Fic [Microscilla marina ATCC 23134]